MVLEELQDLEFRILGNESVQKKHEYESGKKQE